MCDVQRWRGDAAARRAVYNNRNRLRSDLGKEALRLRAEKVERSFEHTLDRGGMRRAWLRGRANLQKRYLVHVAAYNLGLVMRLLLGAGTPRWLASRSGFIFWLIDPAAGLVSGTWLDHRQTASPRGARPSGTGEKMNIGCRTRRIGPGPAGGSG
jgi:hypothetical protein